MEARIKHCVKEAMINEDDTKIEEALKAINRSKQKGISWDTNIKKS